MNNLSWPAVFMGTMAIGALTGCLMKGSEVIAIGAWFWQVFAVTIIFALLVASKAENGWERIERIQTVFMWPPLMASGAFFLDFFQEMPGSRDVPEWIWVGMRLLAWASIPVIVATCLWILCRRRATQPAAEQ